MVVPLIDFFSSRQFHAWSFTSSGLLSDESTRSSIADVQGLNHWHSLNEVSQCVGGDSPGCGLRTVRGNDACQQGQCYRIAVDSQVTMDACEWSDHSETVVTHRAIGCRFHPYLPLPPLCPVTRMGYSPCLACIDTGRLSGTGHDSTP